MFTMNAFSRDTLLLVARILLATLFLVMGWGKLSDFGGAVAYMAQTRAPFPELAAVLATVTELGIGLALVAGVLTTPLALILAGYTLVTGLIGHPFWAMSGMPRYDNMIHFYKNISIIGGLLALAAAGPGRFALTAGRRVGTHAPGAIASAGVRPGAIG
ncbi:DoxX family protein [Gluconacetobacter azotocaptans]|uniref:DoxX family protein n=1 Tax=Gluconacetobacter azotocaptans TaxID=142834 RepID=UPI00195C520E|nr:DoxX family protein [Gluconacetobacter azotocaptans]MBM9401265.1 DoxX family protein [Gluconacetobacter azotocaptans]